jgi:hypothetical protein
MPDFYANAPPPFDVPNDHPFYANPAIVFVKAGLTPLIEHPAYPPPFAKPPTNEIVHPSAASSFKRITTFSTIIARQRNVVG